MVVRGKEEDSVSWCEAGNRGELLSKGRSDLVVVSNPAVDLYVVRVLDLDADVHPFFGQPDRVFEVGAAGIN